MPVGSRSSVAKVSDMGRRLSVPSRAPKSCPRIGSAAAVARRVLIVSWEYPPVVEGGLARHVGKLAEGLAARGDAVDVLTRGRAGEPAREMRAGVRVHRVPAPPTPRDLDEFLRWVDDMNGRMAGAAETIAAPAGGVDVVHGHDWLVAPAAARIAERSRAPYVTTIHATEHGRHEGRVQRHPQSHIHRVEAWMARRADAVIVCSDYMRGHVAGVFGLEEEAVTVIPNGIDALDLRPAGDLAAL